MQSEPWDHSTYDIQQQDLRRIMAAHRSTQMPSRPPKTTFYQNVENVTLWRDVSRLFEEFTGPDEDKWAEREQRFVVVLNDVLVRLRENESVNRRRSTGL